MMLLNLLYPHRCWECEFPLEAQDALFCPPCQRLLLPLRREGRCPTCFREEHPCSFCPKRKSPFKAMGAVYDDFGPAQKLTFSLNSGRAPYLVEGIAGALAATFINWEWPFPDCVTHLPTPPQKRLLRGYEPNLLMAKRFAELLSLPFAPIIKRPWEDTFHPSDEAFFPNKRLLLIGDRIDEDRLFRCGEALLQTFAREVYCLCFTASLG